MRIFFKILFFTILKKLEEYFPKNFGIFFNYLIPNLTLDYGKNIMFSPLRSIKQMALFTVQETSHDEILIFIGICKKPMFLSTGWQKLTCEDLHQVVELCYAEHSTLSCANKIFFS